MVTYACVDCSPNRMATAHAVRLRVIRRPPLLAPAGRPPARWRIQRATPIQTTMASAAGTAQKASPYRQSPPRAAVNGTVTAAAVAAPRVRPIE